MAISIRDEQEKKDLSISHRISGAHSHVFSEEACLCARETKYGRETMERTFITLLPFLIIAIITRIPSGSFCGGERRGAPERETPNDWGTVAAVLRSLLAYIAHRSKRIAGLNLPFAKV